MLVTIDQLDESVKRFESWQGVSGREAANVMEEEAFISDQSPEISTATIKDNILGTAENIEKRKEMLKSAAPEPIDFAYERAIGKNDSVYSNFVELIADVQKKIGRIVVKEGSKNIGFATGFMVSDRLLLTNWHVFKSIEDVVDSEVQFYYELDMRGNPRQSVSFRLQASEFFFTCKELDYCLIAVSSVDVTETHQLSSIGYIYLDPALGKLGNEGEESLNIIHHPEGDYKQLSIRENLFKKIMPTTIWYHSDTAQGSSGSPVFNDQWQVVGLHHMGVPNRNTQGEYLDKNNQPIPRIGGKVDVSKIHWIANEGIRISVILKDVFIRFPDSSFISGLKKRPGTPFLTPVVPPVTLHEEKDKSENMQSENSNVQISFPAALLNQSGSIHLSISTKEEQKIPAPTSPSTRSMNIDESLIEAKKLEDGMDYSSCKGYLPKFLGIEIPLPLPKKPLEKFISKLNGSGAFVLKYYHYSVIHHSVRMMPVISAINVDGDNNKRLDKSKRKDVWLKDNRIDYDIQIGDSYYKGSGFDRGHMSRREDANWGKTAEEAKFFADMTCMYTNACPQIKTLNQGHTGGLWGRLETIVLENGAMQERGKAARISVFNGPIFNDQRDPVFRGIQVPMEFYKIIVWYNDRKELKATAFRLSQSDLVDDIDFEAIDIDDNLTFKEYQCSIQSLERDTKLDFSQLHQYDTYRKADGEPEREEIVSEEELKKIINSL
ncbi:hypothetical protein ESA94_18160 [Lacibacter luteus]|uniref:Serine protease n=1 Tax=Lacibacter luteus TaxID=2508719 RepID=A0A4Q1CF90_9BACT|nr:DNA/RNA non-specific endonuclease [Lacibacter luteus]RXK58556.1 hypothetical protein ESA94_18160 [Lacibacter luteus]